MSEFSTYFENAIIDLMRASAFTEVSAFVALFTDAASAGELEAGTLTNECAGATYARQASGLGAPADGVSSNGGEISFPAADAADWGTIGFVALMDNDTEGAGNVLMFSPLDADKAVGDGDTFKISIGDLTVTIT